VVAPPFKGHIIFENVSFEYEPQRVALRNVSFEVKPGQKAVLAGPSGSGKSTIASLLLRLHDPCEGRILIDGKDIRSYTLESLRSQISIVMQDSPLSRSACGTTLLWARLPELLKKSSRPRKLRMLMTSLPECRGSTTQCLANGAPLCPVVSANASRLRCRHPPGPHCHP